MFGKTKIKYKVLRKDQSAPYQGFEYKLKKWYTEPRVGDPGDSGCVRGFYATDVEGLLYRGVYRDEEAVFRCKVKGREAGDAPLKTCYEKLLVVEQVSEEEVRSLARAEHERLGFNLEEALYPINPLLVEREDPKPTKAELELVQRWASVGASVGASVRASVWDSVRAYTGSLFPNIQKWKNVDHEEGVYPFQAAADLWRAGFVPSFDGQTWSLRAGPKAEVVWEGVL